MYILTYYDKTRKVRVVDDNLGNWYNEEQALACFENLTSQLTFVNVYISKICKTKRVTIIVEDDGLVF